MKSSETIFIFSPAFYLIKWLMTSPKNFKKKFHFENMTDDFLLSYQNLLRYFTPEMMHFWA
jgi:hypothetical protein